MRRVWVIRHDHNDMFLASLTGPGSARWVRDERAAKQWPSEADALDVINLILSGRGIAVECVVPVPAESAWNADVAAYRHDVNGHHPVEDAFDLPPIARTITKDELFREIDAYDDGA